MKQIFIAIIAGVSLIASATILGCTYKYKFKSQNCIIVTGLGEEEFTSDLAVLKGQIILKNSNIATGYDMIDKNKRALEEFLHNSGIADSCIVFNFVNVEQQYVPQYSNNGNYVGQRFDGYELHQSFTVQSTDLAIIEKASKNISNLITKGIEIRSLQLEYFYTRLDDIKMKLIGKATDDAHSRAKKIATEAGSSLGDLKNARMGVFQITGLNENEAYLAGGAFNTISKNKKGRITIKLEYLIK